VAKTHGHTSFIEWSSFVGDMAIVSYLRVSKYLLDIFISDPSHDGQGLPFGVSVLVLLRLSLQPSPLSGAHCPEMIQYCTFFLHMIEFVTATDSSCYHRLCCRDFFALGCLAKSRILWSLFSLTGEERIFIKKTNASFRSLCLHSLVCLNSIE